jgi:hypothetical protein
MQDPKYKPGEIRQMCPFSWNDDSSKHTHVS